MGAQRIAARARYASVTTHPSTPSWLPPPSHRPTAEGEVESITKASDGTRLYVRRRPAAKGFGVRPDAPTVVLCDGVLCDGFVWKYLWDDLATEGPVAHWHYRGHGRSGSPVDPEHTEVRHFAEDLGSVRDHLGNPEVVLIGHSFGVMVALEAIRQRPERVVGVVLCCGSPGHVTKTFHGTNVLANVLPKVLGWVTKHPEIAQALWSRVPAEMSLQMAYFLREVHVENMRPDDLLPYLKHMTTVDFGLFMKILTSAGDVTTEAVLPTLQVPLLVIAADRDTFTPPELAKKMADAAPNSELLMLKDGSHAALIEQPELVAESIRRFLRDRVATQLVTAVAEAG